MDWGWLEPRDNHGDEKHDQGDYKANDDNLVEATLPLKPSLPFLHKIHAWSRIKNLDRVVPPIATHHKSIEPVDVSEFLSHDPVGFIDGYQGSAKSTNG
jgi:hypothetical protein